MAAPSGAARARTAIVVGVCTAVAGLILSITGHPMVGGLINEIAQASSGSQLTRTSLGELYHEPSFAGGTKMALAMFESGLFGPASLPVSRASAALIEALVPRH